MDLKKIIRPTFIILLLLCLQGCGGSSTAYVPVPYSQTALYNYSVGETYLAQGRYALAREQFSYALAAVGDNEVDLKERIMTQLEAADRMIVLSR